MNNEAMNNEPQVSPRPAEIVLPAPLILEATRTAGLIGPLLLALAVFGVSLFGSVTPLTAVIRAAGALGVGSLLGWIGNYLLAHTLLWFIAASAPKRTPGARPAASTRSWEA